MKDKKRIENLQKIVNRLQNENVGLKEALDFEKNKGSQENQKLLESKLQNCINEYRKLNSKYKEEAEKLKKLRSEYNRKMNKVIKSMKRDFN